MLALLRISFSSRNFFSYLDTEPGRKFHPTFCFKGIFFFQCCLQQWRGRREGKEREDEKEREEGREEGN